MLSAVLPGGNFLLGPQTNPRVVINALRNITDVKVLSSPSVVVLDNQLATLLVGDQVPVETQSANDSYKLQHADSQFHQLHQHRCHLAGAAAGQRQWQRDPQSRAGGQQRRGRSSSGAQSLTPTVSQRQVKSAIAVASGQTVLIGGLISETQRRARSGIPILEELPGGVRQSVFDKRQVDASAQRSSFSLSRRSFATALMPPRSLKNCERRCAALQMLLSSLALRCSRPAFCPISHAPATARVCFLRDDAASDHAGVPTGTQLSSAVRWLGRRCCVQRHGQYLARTRSVRIWGRWARHADDCDRGDRRPLVHHSQLVRLLRDWR